MNITSFYFLFVYLQTSNLQNNSASSPQGVPASTSKSSVNSSLKNASSNNWIDVAGFSLEKLLGQYLFGATLGSISLSRFRQRATSSEQKNPFF